MNITRLFLITFSAWLCGCASTSVVSTRFIAEERGEPPQRLLLVARTPEADLREAWEKRCEPLLESDRLRVTPSHEVMPLWYEAGNDPLLKWAAEHRTDAILVAELTGLLLATRQVPPADFMRAERGLDDPGSEMPTWSIPLGEGEAPPPVPPEIQDVEFMLMTADGKPLWNGVVHTHEANAIEPIAASQCRALAELLREQGLLP